MNESIGFKITTLAIVKGIDFNDIPVYGLIFIETFDR